MPLLPPPASFKRVFAYPLFFTSTGIGVLAATGGQQTGTVVGFPQQTTVLTHMCFSSDGAFLFQLTPSSLGGGLFFDQISSETALGPLDRPGLFPIPIVLSGQETLRVVLTNDFGGVANAVKITFHGYRDIPNPDFSGKRC